MIENDINISQYLLNICDKIKENLSDYVYSCEIYGGQITGDGSDYLNFNVNTKAQVFIAFDRAEGFNRGINPVGDFRFSVYVVALPERSTKGFALLGSDITQKIISFINISDEFDDGAIARPIVESWSQEANTVKDNLLYNIFHIKYLQKAKFS